MSYNNSNMSFIDDDIDRVKILTTIGILDSIFTVWIILANVVIVIVILSSAALRYKLRNQLIINICFVDFLVGLIYCPVVSQSFIEQRWIHSCHFTNVLILFSTYTDIFMVMWLLVTLDALYLTKQLRLDLPHLSYISAILVKIFWNGLPWVLLFVVLIPIVMTGYGDRDSTGTMCAMVFNNNNDIHASVIGFFLPAIIVIVLIICFIVFHTCAKPRVRVAEERLLDEPDALEHPTCYIVPSLIVVLFGSLDQILRVLVASAYYFNHALLFKLVASSTVLEVARSGVLPLSWLLLPDLRSAMWDIWNFMRSSNCRPSKTEHQTVSYKKEVESDLEKA